MSTTTDIDELSAQRPARVPPAVAPAVAPEVASEARNHLGLGILLTLTAVAYVWRIDRNGWANTYYAGAVQAGTKSWKAFFFGSLDAGNFITVDKPPFSLWPMEISARIFGLNPWSLLVPQALMGVACVWLLHSAVRRVWGPAAGLLAGTALALTPAAALMFRFDNPDAALTLLLVASAYALTRALDGARLRWLLLCGALIGTAFITKELQALIVLPGFVLAYLVAAPVAFWARVRHLVTALGALLVAGLWWPVLVELVPAGSRPYIGGSAANNIFELALGFNGLGRITGNETGSGLTTLPGGGDGGGPGSAFGGSPGIARLFNDQFAGMTSWLIPAALVSLLAGAWLVLRTRRYLSAGSSLRSDPRVASLVLWGTWVLVTGAVFSFASGIIHPYYSVALAPGVAALAGMTLPALWAARYTMVARLLLAVSLGVSAMWAFVALGRSVTWMPGLRLAVLVVGLAVALGIVVLGDLPARIASGLAALALVAALAAPTAWSLATIAESHAGGNPLPGPAVVQRASFGAGFGAGGPGAGGNPPSSAAGRGTGPVGGTAMTDQGVVTLLASVGNGYTWVAATESSMTQGPLQIASGRAIMALGGFSGGDSAISLDDFKKLVAEHHVRYFIGGRSQAMGGPGGASGTAQEIATWVGANFAPSTVGTTTVYDLSH